MRSAQFSASNVLAESNTARFNLAALTQDACMEGLSSQVTDVRNLAPVILGSLAFSSLRALANPFFSTLFRSSSLIQGASYGSALLGEVAIFRTSHQVLQKEGNDPSWHEPRAFLATTLDFALMKGFSHFFRAQSFALRHSISASAMLAAEKLREKIGWSEINQQSFGQSFGQAMLSSITLEAGTLFSSKINGGRLQRLEQNLAHRSALAKSHTESLRPQALRNMATDGSMDISQERFTQIQGWVWDASVGFDRDFPHLMLLCQSGPEVERELAIALLQMENPRGLIALAARDVQALFRLTSLAELGCADAATGISQIDALPLAGELEKQSNHFISLLSLLKAGLYGLRNFEQVLEHIPLANHERDSLSALPPSLVHPRLRALRLLRNLKKICEERGQTTEMKFLEENLTGMVFDPDGELGKNVLNEPRIFHEVFATFLRYDNPYLRSWISRLPFAQLSDQLPASKDFPRYLRYAVERFKIEAAMHTLVARAEAGDPYAALNINRLHNDGRLPNENVLQEIHFEKLIESDGIAKEADSLELLCLCAQMGNAGAAQHLEAIRNPTNTALIEAHARRHTFYQNQSILFRVLASESPELLLEINYRRVLISALEAWAELPQERKEDYYEMARDDFEFVSKSEAIPPTAFVKIIARRLPAQFGIATRAWIYDPLFDYYEILPESRIRLTKQILKERARNPGLNMAGIEAFIRRYIGRPSYSGDIVRRRPQ